MTRFVAVWCISSATLSQMYEMTTAAVEMRRFSEPPASARRAGIFGHIGAASPHVAFEQRVRITGCNTAKAECPIEPNS